MKSKSKSRKTDVSVSDLCYVYCAIEGDAATLPASGMPEGGPPRLTALDDTLALVVSDVPARIYSADALEPRLSDLDWVSVAGGAHHGVVDALVDAGASVLPVRLFTLFSSDATALSTFGTRRAAITRTLARVRGKHEWVLHIAKPDPRKASDAVAPSPSSGTDFLQAKAQVRREQAARATRVKEDAAAAYEALEQLADEAKTKSVDPNGHLLIDAAFLIPPARVEAMRETLTRRAERLLRDGCAVSLTGPWPAYSFASIDATNG
jgi:hypothetical protein